MPSEQKIIESDLVTYGCYTKSIEALKHYDSLQLISEAKASSANWYAVAAAGFIFSLPIDHVLVLWMCIALGFVTLCYLISQYVYALVNIERFYISYFYNLLKEEEKRDWLPPVFHYMLEVIEDESVKKKGVLPKRLRRFKHHGSPYRKAFFYICNIAVPFFLLICIPLFFIISIKLLTSANEVSRLNLAILSSFRLEVLDYCLICLAVFTVIVSILLLIIGPFRKLLERIHDKGEK